MRSTSCRTESARALEALRRPAPEARGQLKADSLETGNSRLSDLMDLAPRLFSSGETGIEKTLSGERSLAG